MRIWVLILGFEGWTKESRQSRDSPFKQIHIFSFQGVSWVTVHYMLGEVQYGGRVTDDFDKRLLNTYARVWFSQEMFKDTFKFYQGYNIPRCAQIADFKAHIDEMPMSDTPEVG